MEYHRRIRDSLILGSIAFFVIYTAYCSWIYFFTDYYPSERLSVSYQLAVYCAVIWALVNDNKLGHHVYDAYDLGFLAFLFWPIFLPFYLFKSRGLIAIPLLIGLLVIFFVEALVRVAWDYSQSVDA